MSEAEFHMVELVAFGYFRLHGFNPTHVGQVVAKCIDQSIFIDTYLNHCLCNSFGGIAIMMTYTLILKLIVTKILIQFVI